MIHHRKTCQHDRVQKLLFLLGHLLHNQPAIIVRYIAPVIALVVTRTKVKMAAQRVEPLMALPFFFSLACPLPPAVFRGLTHHISGTEMSCTPQSGQTSCPGAVWFVCSTINVGVARSARGHNVYNENKIVCNHLQLRLCVFEVSFWKLLSKGNSF